MSSPDERAMLVMNEAGDCVIVKANWTGFQTRIPGSKFGTKSKSGNAGELRVQVYNLLNKTVEKFRLPGANGNTSIVFGGRFCRYIFSIR